MSKRNKQKKFDELLNMEHVYENPDYEQPQLIHKDGAVVDRKGEWCATHFNNTNPLTLELACGRGEYTLQLAEKYPKAKFILTTRSSSEQWLNSLKKYQTVRLKSKSDQQIKEVDIVKSNYVFSGWTQIMMKGIFNFPDVALYSDGFKKVYEQHNSDVIDYFSKHQGRLLVLNVALKDEIKRFYQYLEVPAKYQKLSSFKQYNKSR